MPEIAVFADFHRAFSLYFIVFLHKNILNYNAHHRHGTFVNKTDFCCRNFLKVTGTAYFRRKTVFFEFPDENPGNMPDVYVCSHLSNFNYQVGPISIQLVLFSIANLKE